MEVVLSPGRFGDETPGAPFQNEEIREWSHVDRLTGMLERARVETGRWKTLNQGAARSYGKVIDSRERNSADGSVVQRARRQVEVFQSEGPGRSVQVVRASQWSSSRVTDSSTTGPLAVTSLTQKNGAATPERLVTSSRLNKLSSSSSLCRDEAISERLSTLLGSFANHTSSSTVPFRRIDSKYASRTPISLPISKRSTSSEDLFQRGSSPRNVGLLATTKSLRDYEYPSCREIENTSRDSRQIREPSLTNSADSARRKVREVSRERKESRDYAERLKADEINVDRKETRDYAERLKVDEISADREETRDHERLRDCEDPGASPENSQSAIVIEEPRTTTTSKAAIQLLPSSKANTTVVNLINDSSNTQAETMDNCEGKRADVYSWILPSSVVGEKIAARAEAEEATTMTSSTMQATTTQETNPRRDSRLEEPASSLPAGRAVKRVGFCKTEIHFAADSGKVNIVETDGKPPPTNKFRRRRRNSLTGVANGKSPAIVKPPVVVETKETLADDGKTRADPNLHRGHTTTVNLGSGIADLAANNERTNRENLAPSEAIVVESTDKEVNPTLLSSVAVVEPKRETFADGSNVVCTDAENNQVLLKVVTIHEPTIATVESDHRRKKIVKSVGNLPVTARKDKRPGKCPAAAVRKSEPRKEHTYVNIFTGSKRAPIYENFKPIEPTVESKIAEISTADANSGAEKKSRVPETKAEGSQSSSCSVLKSREIDNANFDRVKTNGSNAAAIDNLPSAATATEGKLSSVAESDRLLVGSKKTRNTKETKPSRTEDSTFNVVSHSAASSSRGRLGKQVLTKNPTPRSSVSSSERSSRHAAGNSLHVSGNASVSKSSRDVASAKTTNKADVLAKQKPIEVVYQTAVYNMRNEKLKKPPKGKEPKGPRYLNELICGAKMKRPSDSKGSRTSSVTQHGANNKSALPPIKHWK